MVSETTFLGVINNMSAFKTKVLMRIGMTAAQNDERGDQGLARTVGKERQKLMLCDFQTWDFERRSGDSRLVVCCSYALATKHDY